MLLATGFALLTLVSVQAGSKHAILLPASTILCGYVYQVKYKPYIVYVIQMDSIVPKRMMCNKIWYLRGTLESSLLSVLMFFVFYCINIQNKPEYITRNCSKIFHSPFSHENEEKKLSFRDFIIIIVNFCSVHRFDWETKDSASHCASQPSDCLPLRVSDRNLLKTLNINREKCWRKQT